MAKTITTRLDDEYVDKIDKMAAKKGIDRSAILRLFLVQSIKEYMIQDSLEDYTGRMTLWEATQQCNLTLWEMVQEVKQANIHTTYGAMELEKDLKALNG